MVDGRTKTGKVVNRLRQSNNSIRSPPTEQRTPIASDMYLPNHSGVSSHPEFKSATQKVCLIVDNYGSIQEAIDALPSTGGCVKLSNKTYEISSPISISTSNVTLAGAGKSSIIKTTAAVNAINLNGANVRYCVLRDFQINGDSTGSNGVEVDTTDAGDDSYHIIENLFIKNLTGNGVEVVSGTQEIWLRDLRIRQNTGHGIVIEGNDCKIIGCVSSTNTGDGFRFNSSNTIVTNCKAFGNDNGFYCTGHGHHYFTQGEAQENTKGWNLTTGGGSEYVITLNNCVADGNDEEGVLVTNRDKVQIIGGEYSKSGGTGNQTYGVRITGTSTDCFTFGSEMSGNATAQYSDESSGTNMVLGNQGYISDTLQNHYLTAKRLYTEELHPTTGNVIYFEEGQSDEGTPLYGRVTTTALDLNISFKPNATVETFTNWDSNISHQVTTVSGSSTLTQDENTLTFTDDIEGNTVIGGSNTRIDSTGLNMVTGAGDMTIQNYSIDDEMYFKLNDGIGQQTMLNFSLTGGANFQGYNITTTGNVNSDDLTTTGEVSHEGGDLHFNTNEGTYFLSTGSEPTASGFWMGRDGFVAGRNITTQAATQRAMSAVIDLNRASNSSNYHFALNNFVYAFGSSDYTASGLGGQAGTRGGIRHQGTGTISLGGTFDSRNEVTGGGTITDAYNFLAEGANIQSGNTITSLYGLWVKDAVSSGTLTLQYGVKVEDMSAGVANYAIHTGTGQVLLGDDVEIDGDLNHDGSNVGFYGTAPVAQSAAYTPTNVTTDRSFDADSTTVNEVADVLGTLIADLQATGLIG